MVSLQQIIPYLNWVQQQILGKIMNPFFPSLDTLHIKKFPLVPPTKSTYVNPTN